MICLENFHIRSYGGKAMINDCFTCCVPRFLNYMLTTKDKLKLYGKERDFIEINS